MDRVTKSGRIAVLNAFIPGFLKEYSLAAPRCLPPSSFFKAWWIRLI